MDVLTADDKDMDARKVESDIKKKRKHKDKKHKCRTDVVCDLIEVEDNCTSIAAEKQDFSCEEDVTTLRDGEGNTKRKKNKRKKGMGSEKIINDLSVGDNEKQERKTKKHKHCNDAVPKMQDADTHSVATNNDDQGKRIKKKEKAKKEKLTNKGKTDEMCDLIEVEENRMSIAAEKQDFPHEEDVTFLRDGEEYTKLKKKKKKKKEGMGNEEIINDISVGDNEMQFLDDKQETKTKKRKRCDDSVLKMQDADAHSVVTTNDDKGKRIKKKGKAKKEKLTSKRKSIGENEFESNVGDGASAESVEGDPNLDKNIMRDGSEHASSTKGDVEGKTEKSKKKSKGDKRVKFSDQVEVFGDALVQGKRFTLEEDMKLKEAIYDYIDSHGLGDHVKGVDMILHCKSHPEIRGCWKEIALALPHRPRESVYHRGHILFRRDDSHKWTPEELEVIRNFHEKHGANWAVLADAMGKHRFHVKDAWRRIKLMNRNKGTWSQEEYQKLFNLVNADLCMRAVEENRKHKHGMLRDNICWEGIGDKLATRTSQFCCMKWYDQLSSPMVADGEWADTDDYRLLNALYALDACSMDEVDWDYLVEDRPGDVCRKRWNQMVQHIGEHGNKSFSEQVEILSMRYRPDLVEAREAFDNKPVVP